MDEQENVVNPMFDNWDVNLDDIDFEVYEDPETGATTYNKPELTQAEEEEEDYSDFNEDAPIDVTNFFDQADDDAELSFGDAKLKKREVLELATKRLEIENEHTYVQELASNLKHAEKHSEAILRRNATEVDRQVSVLQAELNRNDLTDAQRGALMRELKGWAAKKADLDQDAANLAAIQEGKRQELLGLRVKTTDQAMRNKYGTEWDKNAQDVYNFAIGHGIPYEAISEALCPALADVFVMARKYQLIEAQKKAKLNEEIKSTVARSKRVGGHTQARDVSTTDSTRKQQYFQKSQKGQLTDNDMVNSFNLIEQWK